MAGVTQRVPACLERPSGSRVGLVLFFFLVLPFSFGRRCKIATGFASTYPVREMSAGVRHPAGSLLFFSCTGFLLTWRKTREILIAKVRRESTGSGNAELLCAVKMKARIEAGV